jgi:hypothetical protein
MKRQHDGIKAGGVERLVLKGGNMAATCASVYGTIGTAGPRASTNSDRARSAESVVFPRAMPAPAVIRHPTTKLQKANLCQLFIIFDFLRLSCFIQAMGIMNAGWDHLSKFYSIVTATRN